MVKWRRRGGWGLFLHFGRIESTVGSKAPGLLLSNWRELGRLSCALRLQFWRYVCPLRWLMWQLLRKSWSRVSGFRLISTNKGSNIQVCLSFRFQFIEVQTAQRGLVNLLLVGYSPPLHVAHLCINCAINWSTLWTFECLNSQTPPTPINVEAL